jgi:hypothetical protein
MDLVAAALGDYYTTCNIALLTQKELNQEQQHQI